MDAGAAYDTCAHRKDPSAGTDEPDHGVGLNGWRCGIPIIRLTNPQVGFRSRLVVANGTVHLNSDSLSPVQESHWVTIQSYRPTLFGLDTASLES